MTEHRVEVERREVNEVRKFFTKYDGFRSIDMCSKVTGISEDTCVGIHKYLYSIGIVGGYYFEEKTPPQKYMNYYIKNNFPGLTKDSYILEVGPGDYALFDHNKYPNWVAIDKNYEDGKINFEHREWGIDKYPKDRMISSNWSEVSKHFDNNKFDFVVSSHTFEHVEKPITVLKETFKVLKPNGYLIMFVPDGYMCDYNLRLEVTHTLYLTKDMINEFFKYAEGFADINTGTFRPDYDIVISARKSDDYTQKCKPEGKQNIDVDILSKIINTTDVIISKDDINTKSDIIILNSPSEDKIFDASKMCNTLVFIGKELNGITDSNNIINRINELTMFLFFVLEENNGEFVIVCER